MASNFKKLENDYQLLNPPLGQGSFSVVYEGVDKSGNHFAIKSINKRHIKKDLLSREIQIMKKLNHENILKCKDVYESEEKIYLILELVKGGELYDYIVEKEFNEDEARDVVLQLLSAIEYLHGNGIAHRDLKPENVLCIDKSTGEKRVLQIKVADFGLSKQFSADDLKSRCGSPTYVAPEVIESTTYNEAVDMWALGVITFVLLTGCFPFYEESNDYVALYKKISQVDYCFPDDPETSKEAKDFIEHLLVKEVHQRFSPAQCRNHPWLKKYKPK